jgi:hypothetical protein
MALLGALKVSALLRLSALVLGAGILLWLPFEDTLERWTVLFASAGAAWFAARFLARRSPARPWPFLLQYVSAGLLAGLAVGPLASFLMVFKTGLHGHGAPDFTPEQMAAVLLHTPFFGIGGLLLGLGSGLAILAKDE